MVIQLPKYITHIKDEPKYEYGQQEQGTEKSHSRSTALELSVLKYWWLKPVLRVPNPALSFCYGSKHIVSCSVRNDDNEVQTSWITYYLGIEPNGQTHM